MSLLSIFRKTQLVSDARNLTPSQVMQLKASHHKGFKFGLSLLLGIALMGFVLPLMLDASPYDQDLSMRLLPPVWIEGGSWQHWLGTDGNGRDYFVRILYGARISLVVGLGAATVGMLIGVTLGLISGFYGGWVDQVVNFVLTCQLALPGLLLAMTIVFLVGPSIMVVILVIGVLHWTLFLVVVRATTRRIRKLDYVTAAQAIGTGRFEIMRREILPNLMNQIIVIFTLEVGVAILSEASLSFLGVGIQPPTPSWGLLIAEGKDALFYQPWLIILPGIALFLLVLAINMMGDGIRDITDPESQSEGSS